MLSNMQKRLPSKKDESLKNYAIFGFSCKPMGTISSARKHVFEKKCCKSVAKTVVQKVPSPERRINTGFFGTSKQGELFPLDSGFCNRNISARVILFTLSRLSVLSNTYCL